jgi:DNA-binding response OmpR family regulator
MNTKRILIIDDEADFCKLVKKNLELTGDVEVSITTDSRLGIASAKKIKPHLILLDIMMPYIDGFRILEKLKEDRTTVAIPVVMLSAKGDEESMNKASKLHSENYVTKPIEASELKAKIDAVFAKKRIW